MNLNIMKRGIKLKIAISSDHGGNTLRKEIMGLLEELGFEYEDFGPKDNSSVDYPDYAQPVSEGVAAGKFDKGILICGTGIGMSIAANKVKGIRCALCNDPLSAKLTREHNDSNVLAMGQRIIGEELMKEIVRVWMNTEFSHDERHQRRIDKVSALEK